MVPRITSSNSDRTRRSSAFAPGRSGVSVAAGRLESRSFAAFTWASSAAPAEATFGSAGS
jgi:hypothetical protein